MRTPSIEFFHAKIDKLIRLAQSYTDDDELGFIIQICRLKPHDYVFEGRNDKIVLHRWWFDEFGNSLNIVKKKIKIIYNDLRLDKKNIISTDLYYGLSIDRVVKMSKMVYLCAGKDEDLYQDCYLLSLLGEDDHLRCYLYWYGEWQQVSPLLMGMKHLKTLVSNLNLGRLHRIKSQNTRLPCLSSQAWLTYLPIGEDFLEIIKREHEPLLPILK